MPSFLLFTLYAPLAACGEIAVGERRMGWSRPGRSAILGLVAAALGLKRDDETAHAALESGFGCAVRVDAPGRPFVDYHTAQVPPQRKGRRFDTRRSELAADRLETILSWREYRSDSLYTVALWPRGDALHSLEDLAAALATPRFVLYLGRKSAPLGLPLRPEVVDADSLPAALSQRPWPEELTGVAPADPVEVAFDLDAPGIRPERIERRRDGLGSRQRRQFVQREEGVAVVPVRTEGQ